MNLDFIKTLFSTEPGIDKCEYATQMDFVGNSQETNSLPAVFFHLFQEKASPIDFIGSTHQEVDVYIAFKVVDKNNHLHLSRKAVQSVMLSYIPDAADFGYEPLSAFEFVGGEVVDVVKSVIWWRDIYKVRILKTGA